MVKRRGTVPIKTFTRRRQRATLFVAGVLTAASLVTAAAPASAAPLTAGGTRSTSVSFAAGAKPPEPISPLPQQIARLAIGQVGAQEQGGKNYYPERYRKVNKNIVRPAEWCGVFAYWVWAKAGVTKLPRMKARAGGSQHAQGHWATYWHGWAKAHDRWKPIGKRNPWIGDLVVYGKWRKDGPDNGHIGVVVDVKYDRKGKVTKVRTVEGNIGDRVTDLGWRKITELTGNGHPASGFVSPI